MEPERNKKEQTSEKRSRWRLVPNGAHMPHRCPDGTGGAARRELKKHAGAEIRAPPLLQAAGVAAGAHAQYVIHEGHPENTHYREENMSRDHAAVRDRNCTRKGAAMRACPSQSGLQGITRTQRSSIDCLGGASAGVLASSNAECAQGACSLASES